MKTIGIITYHHYYNYGTMLQAYALQHYIASLGYEAELIDFLQEESMTRAETIMMRIKRLPVYIKQHDKYLTIASVRKKKAEKERLFEEFYSKYLVVGDKLFTSSEQLNQNPPQYDGYIVGSDQTWNPQTCNGPEAFFLSFVADDKKKGSYAPSISISSLTVDQEKRMKKYLNRMKYVSCREFQGSELLKKILERDIATVIDPTLLLCECEWKKVSSANILKKPYILTYFLGDVIEHREFVNKLSLRTGYPVVSIPVSFLEMKNKEWIQMWCGPSEFISLIQNAKYVCTDSFHGTVFSINFNIPFFSFCKKKDSEHGSENSRLYSALELFKLNNRLMKGTNVPKELEIDFTYANSVLETKRQEATDYLEEMLRTITRDDNDICN